MNYHQKLFVAIAIVSLVRVNAFSSCSSSSTHGSSCCSNRILHNAITKSSLVQLSGSLKEPSTIRTVSDNRSFKSVSETSSSSSSNSEASTSSSSSSTSSNIDDNDNNESSSNNKVNGDNDTLSLGDNPLSSSSSYNDVKKNGKNEFELKCGKAIDTLKKDYPIILTSNPDFSLYHDDLITIDPSGVTLHGIKSYKNSFRFLHAIINLFYCSERSLINSRLCYDVSRHNIRVSWNAEIVPKLIFGGTKTTLHVDGISIYELNPISGLITKHTIDHLVINNSPVRPTNGIFNAMQSIVDGQQPHGEEIPVLNCNNINSINVDEFDFPHHSSSNHVVQFSRNNPLQQNLLFNNNNKDRLSSSLFMNSANEGMSSSSITNSQSFDGVSSAFDYDAYQKKNESRKKFGLEPITPQEFEEIQMQVQELNTQQKQKATQLQTARDAATEEEEKNKNNIFNKIFGAISSQTNKDTCETNYDCVRPEVCCDFGFIKKCCSSGNLVVDGLSPIKGMRTVPIPAGTGGGSGDDIGSGYPDGQGPMGGGVRGF